jgi:hypothetical protein
LASCCSIVLPPWTWFLPVIDRAVLVVAAVLGRHDCLAHLLGNLVRLEDDAVLDEDAAEFLAVDVEERRGLVDVVELVQVYFLRALVIDLALLVDEPPGHARGNDDHGQPHLRPDPQPAPEGALLSFQAGSSGAERNRRLRGVPTSSMPLASADRAVTAPLMRLGTVGYSTDAPACFEKNARPSRRH